MTSRTGQPSLDRFASHVPPDLVDKSGAVFYSGVDAFSTVSPVYLLGLNPGGDPVAQAANTVGKHLSEFTATRPDNWSAYRDEAWGGPAGTRGLQPRVLHLLGQLGMDAGKVASSNLVFARSAREASLARGEMRSYADSCWPFHESVIELLEVRAVVCFGQTVGAFVRERLRAERQLGEFVEMNGRRWTSRVHEGRNDVRVVTVTHPSIADWRNPATDVSGLVAQALR